MKSKSLLLSVLACVALYSTGYGQVSVAPGQTTFLQDMEESTCALFDANGDGHDDLLVLDINNHNHPDSRLWFGDGTGSLVEGPNPGLTAYRATGITHGDIDGDNDVDVIIVGQVGAYSSDPLTAVYLNDGAGVFTLQSNSLPHLSQSSVQLADIDSDGDLDLMMMGRKNTGFLGTHLYRNDSTGNFTEIMGTPFQNLALGGITFADVDGDSDLDVFHFGNPFMGTAPSTVNLYTNDGTGTYSLDAGTAFPDLDLAALAAADVDGDNDLDVVLSGDNNGTPTTSLYLNNGTGTYALTSDTSFVGVADGGLHFADMDADGDQDLLLTGNNNTSTHASFTIVYTNDSTGNFTEAQRLRGIRTERSASFGDLDEDGAPELILTGHNDGGWQTATLYSNDGAGLFTNVGLPFIPHRNGFAEFADLDNDGDMDAITGGPECTELYINDGAGNFTVHDSLSFGYYQDAQTTTISIGDLNGDSLPDLLINGDHTTLGPGVYVWINQGNMTFANQWVSSSTYKENATSGLADLDNDGDLDAAVMGGDPNSTSVYVHMLMNDGTGNFSVLPQVIWGFEHGLLQFADLDGDNDQDLLIAGPTSTNLVTGDMFAMLNDGAGGFTYYFSGPFSQLETKRFVTADFDGDGLLDLIIGGLNHSYVPTHRLYVGDGTGGYTTAVGAPMAGFGVVDFLKAVDFDGDGDNDLVCVGKDVSWNNYAALFENDGSGTFTMAQTLDATFFDPSVAVGDVNGDGLPDVYIQGQGYNINAGKLFINSSVACTATADSIVVNACNSYTLPSGTATITTPGTQVLHDTIANACGSDSVLTITLTINSFSATITEDAPVSCNGMADAAASVAPTGGSGPYTYLWSHGPSSNAVASLAASTYTVTVTDSTGCTASDTLTVVAPTVLSTTIGVTHINCGNVAAGGTLTAMPAGGTTAYSYAWSDGAAMAANAGLAAGNYTVTATDARGCTALAMDSIWYTCDQVMNLRPMDKQDSSVWLTWDTVCGATKYKVMWKQAGPGPWNVAYKHSNSGVYFLSGLMPDTTYRWAVKADCGISGWGLTALQQGFTMLSSPCNKPTGLNEAIVQNHQAKLTWVQQPNVHTYRIRYREAGTGAWTVIPKDSVWSHHWVTGLSGSTTYEWQMRSVCEGGTASGTFWTALETFTTPTSKMGQQFADAGHAQAEVRVFPNPSNGLFNVAIEGVDREDVLLTVMDLHGRIVLRKQLSEIPISYRGSIELHHAASGMYVLRVATPAKVFTKRITVN